MGVTPYCLFSSVGAPPSRCTATAAPFCSVTEEAGASFAPVWLPSWSEGNLLFGGGSVAANCTTSRTMPGVIPSNSLRGVLSFGDELLSNDPLLRPSSTFGSLLRGVRCSSASLGSGAMPLVFFCFLSCRRSSW